MNRSTLARQRRDIRAAFALLFALSLLPFTGAAPVAAVDATTFVVTSVDDGPDSNAGDGVCDTGFGDCTLRAAIEEADARAVGDSINFDIDGGCASPCVISPTEELPEITAAVVIDGYTQPGAAWGTNAIQDGLGSNATLKIVLDGSSAGTATGLLVGARTTIRGLVISAFEESGIKLLGTGANLSVIEGNYIGTDVTGMVEAGNWLYGVDVRGAGAVDIGGLEPGQGNVISANDIGIHIFGADGNNNDVFGNYIGTDAAGTGLLGNYSIGIHIQGGSNNEVGRPTETGGSSGGRNVISGNYGYGIKIDAAGSSNLVSGNLIGTDVTGAAALGNESAGVFLTDAHDNVIGGTDIDAGNLIAHNTDQGVRVSGATTTGNAILGNSIFDNGSLGIDNTAGGNTELAAPVVTGTLPISGTACPSCRVEVFSDDADEGGTFNGFAIADAGGSWVFPSAVGGPYVTATATDGSANTSEFSSPVAGAVVCAPGSSGPGGQPPCTPAPAGSYVPGWGASAATLCAVGTFSVAPGAKACDSAPVDTYVDTTGATAATPCPPGTTTNGRTGQVACVAVTTGTIPSATGGGLIELSTSAGGFSNVAAVPETSLPTAGKPTGVAFPYGFVSWTVAGLTAGQSIVVTISFPGPLQAGSPYWKVIGSTWIDATTALGSNDGDGVLTLTITDGGPFDADGVANGAISDPGGPGQPAGSTLSQTISFGPLADRTYGDPDFGVSADASSGLPVTFSSTTTATCMISGSSVHLIAAGTCEIQADQAGDGTYDPAAAVVQPFEIDRAVPACQVVAYSIPYDGLPHTATGTCVGVLGEALAGPNVAGTTHTGAGSYIDSWDYTDATGNYENDGGTVVDVISRADQTITFAALAGRVLGDPDFEVSAGASSGLPVTFSSTTTSTCTISGSSVHLIAAGTCEIQADQAGNPNYNAALSVSRSFMVASAGRPTTTSLFSTRNPSRFTQSVTFAAIVSRTSGTGIPAGTVTFRDGATVLATRTLVLGIAIYSTSSLSLGSHPISATYAPTGAWRASSGSLTQVVTARTTSTTLTSDRNPSSFGQSVTLTAQITSPWGTPTGTITFSDGSTILAVVPLNSSGHATLTRSNLSRGWHTITAIYTPGTATFLTSSGSLSQRVR